MLKPYAFTTADRLAAYIGIATPTGVQLTAMESLINSITEFIQNYTSRTFQKTNYIDIIDTERGQIINLENYPIDSASPFIFERRNSQLNEDKWEIVDGLYYRVDYASGLLTFLDGVYVFRTRQGYRVTYTAGYDYDTSSKFLSETAAGDLEVACWLIGQDMWRNKGVPSNLYQERIGDYSATYQRPVKGATGYAFDNVQALAIIDKYVDNSPLTVLTPLQSI